MIRPRPPGTPAPKKSDSLSQLTKPFKCPGSAPSKRETALPPRKRRKVSYKDAGGDDGDDGEGFTPAEAEVIGNLQASKAFPVFKPKPKDTVFRSRFAVPLANKDAGGYNPQRPAPALGMRKSANFIARPLHDPSGEFAIVLYDPTVDDKKIEIVEGADGEGPKLEVKPMNKMHRSLKEILGLDQNKEKEKPKVPVVIDPRLAKVLRPHQIEGVKFLYRCTTGLIDENFRGCIMADEMGLGKTVGLSISCVYRILTEWS
jgi:DNA repair and recombination RAD54-like protein